MRSLSEDNVLVSLTASRENGEIVYKVECSSNLTKEEFEYYLTEIIKGVCKWNKDLCKERSAKNFKGKIKPRIKKQQNKKRFKINIVNATANLQQR